MTIKILLLTANPLDSNRLRLDKEVREIENGLIRSKNRDHFELIVKWAVRIRDVQRALLDYQPNIVQFSGHGVGIQGITFENENGSTTLVESSSLSELFRLFSPNLKCIILNACYSSFQALEISKHIPYVIGMSEKIGDVAAIEFSVAFYDAIASGKSIEFSFKFGCNAIQISNIAEHLIPVMYQNGILYKKKSIEDYNIIILPKEIKLARELEKAIDEKIEVKTALAGSTRSLDIEREIDHPSERVLIIIPQGDNINEIQPIYELNKNGTKYIIILIDSLNKKYNVEKLFASSLIIEYSKEKTASILLENILEKLNISTTLNEKEFIFDNHKKENSRIYIYGSKLIIAFSIFLSLCGLFLYFQYDELFYSYEPPLCRNGVTKPGYVRSIISHQENDKIRWWVAQDNRGIQTFLCPKDNCSENTYSNQEVFLDTETILDLLWDNSTNTIWAASEKGELISLSEDKKHWSINSYKQPGCPTASMAMVNGEIILGPVDSHEKELLIFNSKSKYFQESIILSGDTRLQTNDTISVLDPVREKSISWIGTNTGLYRVSNGKSSLAFKPPWINDTYFSIKFLTSLNDRILLIGTNNDLLEFDSISNTWEKTNIMFSQMTTAYYSPIHNNLFIGTDNGLGICKNDDGFAFNCSIFYDLGYKVTSITMDANHHLMLGSNDKFHYIKDLNLN